MKKLAFITLLVVGSLALASSLNVPWFSDNADPASDPTGKAKGFVALHNNLAESITCKITYYSADGSKLNYAENSDGTGAINEAWEDTTRLFIWSNSYNTFVISANATVSFRPVAYDPSGACTLAEVQADKDPKGAESDAAVVVPNKPIYGAESEGPSPTTTSKANGACVIEWSGGASDVQGRYAEGKAGIESAYLLPSGT